MENEKKLVLLASEAVIAEEENKLNPVFLSIRMKLADNAGNRNKEGITAAFISDLIKRQDEFECLPFYADVKNLLARNYDNLGHMYNRVTKRFSSTQIGSLTDFYSETDNDGVISLYATARVPKREQEICLRLAELYETGKLNVSFEVRYNPEYTIRKDGVLSIDANEDNALTGIALVSVPACPDATALDMVASVADDSDGIAAECEEQAERGETNSMKEAENVTAEVTEEIVNTEVQDATEAVAEAEVSEEKPTAVAEGEEASDGAGASDGDGAGASESDEGSGSSSDDPAEIDSDEEELKRRQEDAQAEVVAHNIETYESVEKCPETGETVHVQVVTERVVETVEDPQQVIAEQATKIAELEAKVAELNVIAEKYNAIMAEEEARVLAEKKATAKAFAERQGLNPEDAAVAEAIDALDYTKIAELTMAQAQEEKPAEQVAENKVTLASFVEFDINNDGYGGLLSRRNK